MDYLSISVEQIIDVLYQILNYFLKQHSSCKWKQLCIAIKMWTAKHKNAPVSSESAP